MNRAVEQHAALLAAWAGAESPPEPDAARQILLLTQELLESGGVDSVSRAQWCRYLELTRHPDFLTSLPDAGARQAWAATTFTVCEEIGFNLDDLLEQRTAATPERVLFRDLGTPGAGRWTYSQIQRRVRSVAALFHHEGRPAQASDPSDDGYTETRIALLCENSIGSACCDLACLTQDLFVTPLHVHFSTENLAWIFDRLQITAAVCDHPDRLEKLLAVRRQTKRPFRIFTLNNCRRSGADDIHFLEERLAQMDADRIESILQQRRRFSMREIATVMFTSGSTGRPKGVAFNLFNLVSKRFARAAALPEVGRDETLLCYLPLYHTFGRYLEMLGTIFWGGTYVFSGNPSAETLISQFREVRPTALISVPIRWVQIRDRVLGIQSTTTEQRDSDFRQIVGDRLYWGLSAAGYLDPAVFRFFHRRGVALCSGFGMTEGTGGLTMTPPQEYVEDSVGIPLPGVKVRFGEHDELQIAGPYIARYLPEDALAGSLVVEAADSDDHWLATGDLFRVTRNNHLEIVDRIKDIYKNNRGQTIAPRKVEAIFDGVPGIKRTFLAGDGRAFNTLLIVPDDSDELLQRLTTRAERREYFQQIITTANPGLAPFERVVNFEVLDRDFDETRGELTAKGSYRRKTIEKSFAEVISQLYQTNAQIRSVAGYEIRIPRWFFRDLGVLEDAIAEEQNQLVNRETGRRLTISVVADGRVRIGNLEYLLQGKDIDLGLVSRQPRLWLGNPQLVDFCPCLAGWDTGLGPFGAQVFLPADGSDQTLEIQTPQANDDELSRLDKICQRALFGDRDAALEAIGELELLLAKAGNRRGDLIRRRLEAVANHPVMDVRSRAYRVLVLDQPVPDYLRFLPAFVESGKPFLDESSFEAISKASLEPRRLQAFRQRLYSYRTQLVWPAPARTRQLFLGLFRLLADFARYHTEYYRTIRKELVCWITHESDPELAAGARKEFDDLANWFEERLAVDAPDLDLSNWEGKVAFQSGLSIDEERRLRSILIGTTFLKQSLLLAFEEEQFSLDEIGPNGIWVSRIISAYESSRYRVSINTRAGKHFDVQLWLRNDIDQVAVQEMIFWYIALRGYPFGTPMLPPFGCCRPELGAISMAYVSDLTVWEKIREFSSVRGPGTRPPTKQRWHQLLVRAMSVIFKGWRNSGRRIIPGPITPNNLVVPEPDFRKGAVQNNLSGWRRYEGPLSLIRPVWSNLIQHTLSHYPWTREYLEIDWIFEAVTEALGVDAAGEWLKELETEMVGGQGADLGEEFSDGLREYIVTLRTRYYQPLALRCAIGRFAEWDRVNPQAPLPARLEILEEVSRLYQLERQPEIARYTLFRETYFRHADLGLLDIFDRLLIRMFRHPERRATAMVELSDLQAHINDPDDRIAFNRLAFPNRPRTAAVEIRAVGDPERDRIVVRSTIVDRLGLEYSVGEPSSPAEVGQLYRLFLRAGFPRIINEAERYLVAADETEQSVGGVVYRELEDDAVMVDGIVVAQPLTERGIASAILDDFCTRMAARGYKQIKTHFFLRRFYQRHGFKVDQRSGGLVRHL